MSDEEPRLLQPTWWRRFIGVDNPRTLAPSTPVISAPIDAISIKAFWVWSKHGALLFGKAKRDPHFKVLRGVAITNNPSYLVHHAQSKSEWVRLAVATNTSTPINVVWGGGGHDGLVNDDNGWVAAAAIMRHPSPPKEIMQQIMHERDKAKSSASN